MEDKTCVGLIYISGVLTEFKLEILEKGFCKFYLPAKRFGNRRQRRNREQGFVYETITTGELISEYGNYFFAKKEKDGVSTFSDLFDE